MKNEIKIPKGTTYQLCVTVREDGAEYEYREGDTVRFGVKRDPEDDEFIISKTAEYDTENGYFIIDLAPEDTAELPVDRYWYDVGLQTADGDYYMIIPADYFSVLSAVTAKAVTE